MRIGIDARELGGNQTGVGRYLYQLLAQWDTLPEARDHAFILYAPSRINPPLGHRSSTLTIVDGAGGTWWEQVGLAAVVRRDPPDVFFAPAYTAPLRLKTLKIPLALAIHDVSFVAHPEWFSWREGWRRRWLTGRSAGLAKVILTDSDFSKREITARLGVPATTIWMIPPGVSMPCRLDHRPAREPLILFVGSIFNRRRVPELIQAFALLARAHPQARLEIVGENRTYPHQDLAAILASAGVVGRAAVRAYVPDQTLAALYARASAFAFLSEYEGFGLPPLEALAAGVPIVVLDTPVAREVYGDAAIYVRSGDLAGTAAALKALLLMDEGARAGLLARAGQVLARYSWERAARDTLAAIEEATREPSPRSGRSPQR